MNFNISFNLYFDASINLKFFFYEKILNFSKQVFYVHQCLKCLVFENNKTVLVWFAKLIISLSLIDPEG